MEIGKVSNTISCTQRKPNFEGAYPTRYWVCAPDGGTYKIADEQTVRKLQKTLILWLNKAKAEQPKEGSLASRLVKFLSIRDNAYANEKNARSFYDLNRLGEVDSFILTGKEAQQSEEAGKLIGHAKQYVNAKADVVSQDYGMSYARAKEMLTKDSPEILDAKKVYYNKMRAVVETILGKDTKPIKVLDFYYNPVVKNGKHSYELKTVKMIDV